MSRSGTEVSPGIGGQGTEVPSGTGSQGTELVGVFLGISSQLSSILIACHGMVKENQGLKNDLKINGDQVKKLEHLLKIKESEVSAAVKKLEEEDAALKKLDNAILSVKEMLEEQKKFIAALSRT
ncbi:hypothetical protein V6N13_027245 [Hibiscus sabdariffa]|uniref:Uncharacterized protein n=2 Tax=Hibiscus sabdariffa TaxID=183260 RepID=A0ABR2B3S2_9ROSI